jgi:hypothetical protein
MVARLAQFVAIMLYVLVAGVMWGTWLSLGRTMTRYDAMTFLADGKHMIANLATIMAVLMISATLPPAGEQREPSSLHGRQRGAAGWGGDPPSAGDVHGAQEFTEPTRSGKD